MAEIERRGPWIVRESRRVYDNPWIRVTEHTVTRPDGSPGIYGTCEMKWVAVGVVPVDEQGHVWLVGQHRFPRDYYSWELPEGAGDPAVPAVESAKRELREETGLTARGWRELLQLDFSNAVTNEVGVAFLAWDLERGEAEPDPGEKLEIRRVPFREALDMAMAGEIRDAFTQLMLYKVDLLGRRGELPEKVGQALGYPASGGTGEAVAGLPAVIRRYLDAYNACDVDGMLGCLTDDVEFRNIAGGEVTAETRGRAEFAELARFGAGAFSWRRQTVVHGIAVADRTMLDIRFEAVVAADLPNGWKAGQSLAFSGSSYIELRDGKIVRIVDSS